MYILAKNLEDAKRVARRENRENSDLNQVKVSSGRLYKRHLNYNEYVFVGKYSR